jgi:hypothetical protein
MIQSSLKDSRLEVNTEIYPIFEIDTIQFSVSKSELLEQWIIEKEEYDEFIKSTCDSVVRESLYYELTDDKKADRFLNNQDSYFDEEYLEFIEYEPSNKIKNRELFSLNYKSKIRTRKEEVESIVLKTRAKNEESLNYCYLTIDSKESLKKSKFLEEKKWHNYSWFEIDTNYVEILPIQEIDSTERFMKLLTHNQALAFYHWKYPISKSTESANWKNYIFPTKNEFTIMQSGEYNLIQDKSFEYTTNSLHYRIRFWN